MRFCRCHGYTCNSLTWEISVGPLRLRCLMDLVLHIHIFLTGRESSLTSECLLRPTTFGTGNRTLVGSSLVTSALGWNSRAASIYEVSRSDVMSLNFLWHGLNSHKAMRYTHSGVSEMLQRVFQKINILGRQKICPYSLVRSLLLHSSVETTACILLELHQLGNEGGGVGWGVCLQFTQRL